MPEENPIYFKQLLSGVNIARGDDSARNMANFIYLIGDTKTRECVVVDPAWDITGLLDVVAEEDMNLTGALVTHYHPDHVGGQIFGMDIIGLAELMDKNPVPVNQHYDVYSMGEDGVTSTPFTSNLGKDDVVLAGDGGYFGLVKDH